MKPRLLDLFCGAGGAAAGYQRAGFYVVGVDHKQQPNLAEIRERAPWQDVSEAEVLALVEAVSVALDLVAGSALTFSDERLAYEEFQMDRGDMHRLRAALAPFVEGSSE